MDELELRSAFLSNPLLQELNRLAEAGTPPNSDAKRHHFIPRFLLREFAIERDGKHWLSQLELKTGQHRRVTVESAASRHRFYTVRDEDGTTHNQVEGYLALVESHAAPAIKRYLADPVGVKPTDAAMIAHHLALLIARTPAASARMAEAADTAMRLLMSSPLIDAAGFARHYREATGNSEAAAEEVEQLRKRMLEDLRNGTVRFSDERLVGLQASFQATGDLAQIIFQMPWTLLVAKDGEFITSDCGGTMFDPQPRYPWTGNSLLSSDHAQTTIPLSPKACLLLTVGLPDGNRRTHDADRMMVDEVNLRTYGWAARHIFGASQQAVTDVRHLARKNPSRVPRPRPFRQVILIDAEPGDDRLAREHARRGWPEQFLVRGIPHDYVVIDERRNPVEHSVKIHELTKRRAMRSRRTAELTPDIVPVDPRDVQARVGVRRTLTDF